MELRMGGSMTVLQYASNFTGRSRVVPRSTNLDLPGVIWASSWCGV